MTSAPATLLAARRLLLDHLGAAGLASAEVGIVGDPAHRGGYHCGADRVLSEDYSVVESSRDRTGLSDYACALDVGDFSVSIAGKRHTLASFSMWLVAQCKAGAADTKDIREVIYSPDGVVVRRWDRLGRRTSGDSSHRWHTHISYHRDAIKAGRDQSAVMRRYLTYIGLIQAPTVEDDMSAEAEQKIDQLHSLMMRWRGGMPTMSDGKTPIAPVDWRIRDEDWQVKVTGLLAAISGQIGGLDTEQVLARIEQLAAEDRQRDAELPARVLAALPAGEGPVSRDDLEAALRSVLGSVDNPPAA